MAYIPENYSSEELYHYGIQGMKWYVRRFQNEDGSLTEAGKRRYTRLNKKIQRKEQKIQRGKEKIKSLISDPKAKKVIAKEMARKYKLTNKARKFENDYRRSEMSNYMGQSIDKRTYKRSQKYQKYNRQIQAIEDRMAKRNADVARLSASNAKYADQIAKLRKKLEDLETSK